METLEGRHGAALAGRQAGTPADARWAGRARGDEAEAAQPRRRQLDVPVQRRGNLGGRSGRRVCERLVDTGGRLGNAFGKVLRLALHAQQALVDDLGAALEAFGEFAHLLAQALVLLRQVLQRDGLSQGQAGKAAEEGADQRFPGEAAEDQAHQHENPLHASNP